jgi:hypothetical protein
MAQQETIDGKNEDRIYIMKNLNVYQLIFIIISHKMYFLKHATI